MKNRFVFQWHINETCNLNCSHCYQSGPRRANIGDDEAREVIRQIHSFRPGYQNHSRKDLQDNRQIHVNLTGGEPFLHPHVFDYISRLKEQRNISTGILSNGTIITASIARQLKSAGVSFVQVSIDGCRSTHDQIRGEGSYVQAVEGLRILKNFNIPAHISFTATRSNYREYPEVAALGRKTGAVKVWTDRVIPSANMDYPSESFIKKSHNEESPGEESLNKEEVKKYIEIIAREQNKIKYKFVKTSPQSNRALQFLGGGLQIYHCGAAKNLLAILPGGDVYPCRRLPIKIGNVFESDLENIFQDNIYGNREKNNPYPEGCEKCFYVKLCQGGLKCLSFALTGNPDQGDPGCWMTSAHTGYSEVAPQAK